MYQQQQYQTANYRGNQQGHDQYLRADSQQPSSFSSSFGQPVASQYRGFQRTYQPTGMVQSFYGQSSRNQSFQNFNQSNMNTGSFHASNYRGNQQGHDQYLRADSQQPSGFGMGQSSGFTSSFNQSNAYHTSNYRGNQPGHDQYLRADATQPSGTGMGQSTESGAYHTSNYRGNQQGHDQYLRADATQPSGFSNQSSQFQYQSSFQPSQSQFSGYRGR